MADSIQENPTTLSADAIERLAILRAEEIKHERLQQEKLMSLAKRHTSWGYLATVFCIFAILFTPILKIDVKEWSLYILLGFAMILEMQFRETDKRMDALLKILIKKPPTDSLSTKKR